MMGRFLGFANNKIMSHFGEEPRAHAPSARHQNQNSVHREPDTNTTPGANSQNARSTQRDTNTSPHMEQPLQGGLHSPHNGSPNQNGGLYRRIKWLKASKNQIQREHDSLRHEHDSLRREHDNCRRDENQLRQDHDDLLRNYDNLQRAYDQIKHLRHSESEAIRQKMNQGWRKRLRQYIAPYLESKGLGYNEVLNGSLDNAIRRLVQDALQAESLRTQARVSKDQMQALQQEMLSRVEKVPTTPDEQLAQDFRAIKAMVRTLSRSIQIAPDADVSVILHSDDLALGISEHEWNTRAGRKRTVEAFIWYMLAEQLFDHPFSILGILGPLTNHVWKKVFGEMHYRSWPVPTAQCERWRYTTMDSAINAKATPQHGTIQSHMDQSIAQVPVRVSEVIRSNLLLFAPTDEFANVKAIVDKAISLAREMALQRCRLQVTFPRPGEVYNPDRMTTLSDSDGDDVEEGTVMYTVNPGLAKWGDAHGEKLDQRLDIVPALVQLEPKGMMGMKLEPQD